MSVITGCPAFAGHDTGKKSWVPVLRRITNVLRRARDTRQQRAAYSIALPLR
jgi:hypothetical protein